MNLDETQRGEQGSESSNNPVLAEALRRGRTPLPSSRPVRNPAHLTHPGSGSGQDGESSNIPVISTARTRYRTLLPALRPSTTSAQMTESRRDEGSMHVDTDLERVAINALVSMSTGSVLPSPPLVL